MSTLLLAITFPAQFQASFSPIGIPEAAVCDQGDAGNLPEQALGF
jgi:hypothetical protein